MMRPTCYNQQGISTAPRTSRLPRHREVSRLKPVVSEAKSMWNPSWGTASMQKNITDWHATCCSKMTSIHRSTGLLDVDFQDVSVLDAKPLSRMSRHMGKGSNLGVLSNEDGSTKRWACPKKCWRLQNDHCTWTTRFGFRQIQIFVAQVWMAGGPNLDIYDSAVSIAYWKSNRNSCWSMDYPNHNP